MQQISFDVVIVGAGMVGLSLALGLEEKKFKVAVIDSAGLAYSYDEEGDEGTVSAINDRSQNFLSELGIWQSIMSKKFGVYREMKVWPANSKLSLDISSEEMSLDNLGYIIENNLIKHYLVNAIRDSNVTIFEATKIDRICKKSEKIWQLVLSSGKSFSTSLIVGADGTNSYIRKLFNFEMFSRDYKQNALVTNVRLESLTLI